MRPLGWLGAILGLMAILVAAGIGFAVGAATTIPAGTAVTHIAWGVPFWGFPFFPLFGFLFLILLVSLVVRGGRRAAWGGRGWYGPGPWGPGAAGADDPRRQAFEEWHRQAHAGPRPTPPNPQGPAATGAS